MAELDPTTQRILGWAKRLLVATKREQDGLGVRDLVCGFAALADDDSVRGAVAGALGVDQAAGMPLAFPPSALADVERAAVAADQSRKFDLQADVKEAVDRAYRDSPSLAPRELARELLVLRHPLVIELRRLNGAPEPPRSAQEAPATAPGTGRSAEAPAGRPTPVLDAVGFDLTRAAREGRLGRVIGREAEIEMVVETLCRRLKRNPLLIGPAGVGKTAVAEAVAQRIAAGAVPAALRGTRIVQIRPSVLMARAPSLPQFIDEIEAIVREASQPGIVLLIDELHAVVGAGGYAGRTDLASLLLPALARGELACIGATTDYEYQTYIRSAPALERRFVALRIQELTAEQTLAVLADLRAASAAAGIEVPDDVAAWIVDFAGRYMRNRYFPDKAIDLLDQCVAHATVAGASRVTRADAEVVAGRMVEVRLDGATALRRLQEDLVGAGLVDPAEAELVRSRLDVTLSGLDVRPERPNAVLLLAEPASDRSRDVARALAGCVAGSPDRVVVIDLAGFVHEADVSRLIGAGPGYVGHGERLPIHELLQAPTSVLLLENVHACHPRIRDFLRSALAGGVIRDGQGENVYLSDAVVVLTAFAGSYDRPHESIGFARPEVGRAAHGAEVGRAVHGAEVGRAVHGAEVGRVVHGADGDHRARAEVAAVLGEALVDEVDVVIRGAASRAERTSAGDFVVRCLGELAERYRPRGVEVAWGPEVVAWLAARTSGMDAREVERAVDDLVSRRLLALLHAEGSAAAAARIGARRIRLSVRDGELAVTDGEDPDGGRDAPPETGPLPSAVADPDLVSGASPSAPADAGLVSGASPSAVADAGLAAGSSPSASRDGDGAPVGASPGEGSDPGTDPPRDVPPGERVDPVSN